MNSFILDYRVGWNNAAGRCRVDHRLIGANPPYGVAVVVTELADNPGPSITNAAEVIATAAAAELGLEPGRMIYIEHYGPRASHGDTYDLVMFSWERTPAGWVASSPGWKHLRIDTAENLAGMVPSTARLKWAVDTFAEAGGHDLIWRRSENSDYPGIVGNCRRCKFSAWVYDSGGFSIGSAIDHHCIGGDREIING